MPENNLTKDLAPALSIDLVHRFGSNISKLLEAMQVTRRMPMASGSVIKIYKTTVTKPTGGGTVAEGAVIPLTKVDRAVDRTIELAFKKYRKSTSIEAVQKYGYNMAMNHTDDALLKEIQKELRADLFAHLATAPQKKNAADLQGALATAWGAVQTVFEDDGAVTVAFVNPLDIADYLSKANVTLQTAFGMSYLTNMMGVDVVLVNTSVPQGKIYATAADNIGWAYAPVTGGEIGKMIDLTSDETGMIGVVHEGDTSRLTSNTVVTGAMKLYTEVVDGVIEITIGDDGESAGRAVKTTKAAAK